MVNTDEIQAGSRSLVRRQGAIKRSVLFYTLRRFNKSQRQGGPGRQKGKGRHIHYRQVVGLVALVSSEQTVLEVNV